MPEMTDEARSPHLPPLASEPRDRSAWLQLERDKCARAWAVLAKAALLRREPPSTS
jgi:hypothetical protein